MAGVEMVWEDVEPGAALTDRFGFSSVDAVRSWAARVLAEEFGVTVRGCERVAISDRNALAFLTSDAGPLVLKWSVAREGFARLAALAEVAGRLGDRGLPVVEVLRSRSGVRQIERDGVSLQVQRMVSGSLLDVGRAEEVRDAGATLATIHRELAEVPVPAAIAAGGTGAEASGRGTVLGWLACRGSGVEAEVAGVLRRLVDAAGDEPLPIQLVHGDYRGANILCREGRVVGVLDLETARVDHRVMELARSAVQLGTHYRDWGPVPAAVHDELLAGYESVEPLSDVERAWWPALVLWWTLLFVPDGDDPTGWGASARELAARVAGAGQAHGG